MICEGQGSDDVEGQPRAGRGESIGGAQHDDGSSRHDRRGAGGEEAGIQRTGQQLLPARDEWHAEGERGQAALDSGEQFERLTRRGSR